ncbi:fructuronate reductase [Lipingzhangella halophila]|uniref:Mannitol-1-phosphate 5-dehydrogenase n=1 Tax=Lipingzhangella halophila TaxID=1783352 RepID=A0A7W7W589_9ACTN|nr:mannitol dehydrogenase family protein [Lipingzhangella halophila]MBB4934453.1 fructuronate reductase [Lipingzhangella halophila]
MPRLNLATLGSVPPWARSTLDPRDLAVGIVHLGIGGFHRAHQAVFTEDAMLASGQTRWAISAVTQRGPRVRDELAPQDGLYTVTTRSRSGAGYRVVPVVREVIDGPSQVETALDRIADPAVSVVTLTVTEKAYRLDPAQGRLDTTDPDVRADAAGAPPQTVVGRLVAGLRRRQAAGAGALAVVCCDNLPDNGRLLRRAVFAFCALLPGGDGLAAWIAEHVTFPSSMVDRIVPATTEAERAEVEAALGVRDEAAVVAEPFGQWVIEDDFRSPRPAWERAGALVVPDVRPYELTKLRTLNACHSLLAYAGVLAGIGTIAEAVAVPELQAAARRLAQCEVRPTLPVTEGLDHHRYVETVLDRFANPALQHTTQQVAADGSLKVGPRLLGTAADGLELSTTPAVATLAIAAWLRCVLVAKADDGSPLAVSDPAADSMRTAARNATGAGAVRPALAAAGVSGALLDEGRFTGLVESWYTQLAAAGVRATAREAAAG